MAPPDISQLIDQLSHKSSPKRRSAAKKLRKLKAKVACPALLAALQNELKDKRTWETQYQMIMALGESGCIESLGFLTQLSEQELEPMIHVALGDAITRLKIYNNGNLSFLEDWLDENNEELLDGAFRAIAMLHIIPEIHLIQKIIQYASLPENRNIQFWVTAATPGWPKELTASFIKNMAKSAFLEDTKKAAEAALNGRYLKWNPL